MRHNRTPGKAMLAALTVLLATWLTACPQPEPAPITTPPADGLRFDPLLDVALGADIQSNESVLKGITAAAPISISAGGSYSKNGAPFTSSAGTVVAGDRIRLINRSASLLNTQTTVTLTIGQQNFSFSVTTIKNPSEIVFASKTNQLWNAAVESDPVTLSAISAGTALSVTGGQYRLNAGAFTAANGTVNPGDTITLRGLSASADAQNTVVSLTIGTQPRTFTVQTGTRIPDAFDLPDALGVEPSTSVTRSFTVAGITIPSPITVTNASLTVNGAPRTSPSTVVNGDTVAVTVVAPATADGSSVTATVTVGRDALNPTGGRSDTFSVTTRNANPGTISFASKTNQLWNVAVESDPVTLGPIGAGTPITVSGGQYSKNSAAFTAANGTVGPGDTIKLRGTSASADNASVTVTLSIGGQSPTFTIQTGTRIPTSFNPALTDALNVEPSDAVTRNFTVSGITIPSPIIVTNASLTVNGAPRTSPSTVVNGDAVAITATAPTGFSSSLTVSVTVGRDALNPSGGLAGSFMVTTRSAGSGGTTFTDQNGVTPNNSQAEVAWSGSDDCNGIYPPNPASPCLGLSGDPRYLKPLPPPAATFTQSNTITVSGVSPNTPITVSGGEYSKNGGAYTALPGTVSNGDGLRVRVGAILPGAQYLVRVTFGTGGSTFNRDFNVTTANTSRSNVWTNNAISTPVAVPSNSTATSTISVPTISATIKRVRVLVTLAGSPLRRSDMVIRLVSPGGTTLTLMDFVNNKTTAVGSSANCKTYLPIGKNPLDPRNAPSCYPANTLVSVPLASGTVQQRPWPWNVVDEGFFDGGWGGPVDTIFDSSNFGTNGTTLGPDPTQQGIYDVGSGIDTYLDGGIIRNDVYRRCGTDFYPYRQKRFNSDPDDPSDDLAAGADAGAVNAALNRSLPRAGAIDPYTNRADGRADGRLGKFLGEYFEGQCKRREGDVWYPPVAPDPRIGNLTSLNNSAPGGTWTLQVQNTGSASGSVTITAFKLIFDF